MSSVTNAIDFKKFQNCRPRPGFDVIPFLDALLIAVFFFLNASDFVFAPGMRVDLPATTSEPTVIPRTVTVLTIGPNDLIFFDGAKIPRGALAEQLLRYVRQNPDAAQDLLLVKTAADLSVAELFTIMDEVRAAGFSQIHLAAEPRRPAGPRVASF